MTNFASIPPLLAGETSVETLAQIGLVNGFRCYLIYYRTFTDRVEIPRVIHGLGDQNAAFGQS